MQNEFFERAATGLSSRGAMLRFLFLGALPTTTGISRATVEDCCAVCWVCAVIGDVNAFSRICSFALCLLIAATLHNSACCKFRAFSS